MPWPVSRRLRSPGNSRKGKKKKKGAIFGGLAADGGWCGRPSFALSAAKMHTSLGAGVSVHVSDQLPCARSSPSGCRSRADIGHAKTTGQPLAP
jgi:hypothetical protein